MRIEQFRYLLKVMETKSLTAAASQLFISQQAVSQAIQGLEKELGTQLLKRSYQGVDFTDEGLYVAGIGAQIVVLLKELESHFHLDEQRCGEESLNMTSGK